MKYYYNYPTVGSCIPPPTDYLDLPITLFLNDLENEVIEFIEKLFIGSIEGTNQSTHLILQCYEALYYFALEYAYKYMKIASFHKSAMKIERKGSKSFRLYYFNKHELVLGQITFEKV